MTLFVGNFVDQTGHFAYDFVYERIVYSYDVVTTQRYYVGKIKADTIFVQRSPI